MWGACHQKESYEGEVFLWQLEGESEVTRDDGSTTVLQKDSCIIIPAKEKLVRVLLPASRSTGSTCLVHCCFIMVADFQLSVRSVMAGGCQ